MMHTYKCISPKEILSTEILRTYSSESVFLSTAESFFYCALLHRGGQTCTNRYISCQIGSRTQLSDCKSMLEIFGDSPFLPGSEICFRSMKCVARATSPMFASSITWTLIFRTRGGNISMKLICSFHIGSVLLLSTDVSPYTRRRND